MNAGTAQQYARWIGALYVITIVAGGSPRMMEQPFFASLQAVPD